MKVGRKLWAVLGLVFVGLGLIGAVVPGMPTTIFMILALYCFKRGSKKFEDWLLNHRVFGPTLRDWERYKGMRRHTKIVAVSMLWVFLLVSLFFVRNKPSVFVIVLGSGVWVTWYILSRPTVPVGAPSALVEMAGTLVECDEAQRAAG